MWKTSYKSQHTGNISIQLQPLVLRYQQMKLQHFWPKVSLKQAGVITFAHPDKQCLVFFVYQSVVLILMLIGTWASQRVIWKFENIPCLSCIHILTTYYYEGEKKVYICNKETKESSLIWGYDITSACLKLTWEWKCNHFIC